MSSTWDYDDLAVSGTRRQLLVRGGALALSTGAAGVLLNACGGNSGSGGGGGPEALETIPRTPFDPNVPPGTKPDLPRRLAWSLPATGELFTNFDKSVRAAAEGNDLEYISAQANGDSAKQVQQTQSFLTRGVGGLIFIDVAPPALGDLQLQCIEQGAVAFSATYAPSTTTFAWDEYLRGTTMARPAVKFIEDELGGKAKVCSLVISDAPHLKRRFQGVRDVLEKEGGPGVELVEVDGKISAEEGVRMAQTVLQKHPDVKVWIGQDSMLVGALSALEAADKAGSDVGLFGIDGDEQALAEIEKGGPYKSTLASAFGVLAYAWGQYAADWLAGKSIPIVMNIQEMQLDSKESIDAFNEANEQPAAALEENRETFRWYKPVGNTSFEDNKYLKVNAEG